MTVSFAEYFDFVLHEILGRQTCVIQRPRLLLVRLGVVFDFAFDRDALLDLPLQIRRHGARASTFERGRLGHVATLVLPLRSLGVARNVCAEQTA